MLPDPLSPGHSPAAGGELRLPRPPGVFRKFWARHPWWADSLIAAGYALLWALPVAVTRIIGPGSRAMPGTAALAPLLASVALASVCAVLFRRRAPRAMLALAVAAVIVSQPEGLGLLAMGVCILLYSVAVYHSTAAAWIGWAVSAAALVVSSLIGTGPTTAPALQGTIPWVLMLLAAVLVGVNVGNRRRYLQALVDRAVQLARERDQQARLSAAAERARIAREMHDIVSHSLTVMVALADGSAASVRRSPDRAEDAMLRVADTGRRALADMRRMLGVLRIDTEAPGLAEREPQPTATQLVDLIDRSRAAGLSVRFQARGRPPDNAALQLTVFRVVQEALTNALRHAATAADVEVRVEFGAHVSVTVENSAPVADTAPVTPGAGRGLIGLRERVMLFGGTLEAGPTSTGGWRVAAILYEAKEDGWARIRSAWRSWTTKSWSGSDSAWCWRQNPTSRSWARHPTGHRACGWLRARARPSS